MFTDRAIIFVKSGSGGHGIIAFHREKFVAAGGPDGGDGGNGGSIIFKVDTGMTTLADFRYKRKYVAENGANGSQNKMTGKNAPDVYVRVPQGTIIKDNKTGAIIADLVSKDDEVVVAKGGRGGFGNYHFATATRQIPNFAKGGEAGVELEVCLELKLLADVGLVGFPNAGKSSILSITTSAKPEIANYPFTTMNPHLGVVDLGEGSSFVMADIPGLIEGASEGKGVGHRFLRHIERTRLLLHVIDMAGTDGRDPFDDFIQINEELKKYNEKLGERPQIFVANKTDVEDSEVYYPDFKEKFDKWIADKLANDPKFSELYELGCFRIFEVSAITKRGIRELMSYVDSLLPKLPETTSFEEDMEDYVIPDSAPGEELFHVEIDEDGVFVITGRWIEHLFSSINLEDNESQQYFQRIIRAKGLIDKLEEMGIEEEDTVRICDTEFDFMF